MRKLRLRQLNQMARSPTSKQRSQGYVPSVSGFRALTHVLYSAAALFVSTGLKRNEVKLVHTQTDIHTHPLKQFQTHIKVSKLEQSSCRDCKDRMHPHIRDRTSYISVAQSLN